MSSSLSFSSPVIAHRGACMLAPENTLASIRAARDQGISWVEVDVKISQDGVPILMHDDLLDRTTNGHGPVADATWARLRELDAGSWFSPAFAKEPVPNLDAVMDVVIEKDLQLLLELKPCPGRARATTMVTLIEMAKSWPEGRSPPLVCSFDAESLEIAAQLQPPWPRAFIVPEWRSDCLEIFHKVEASALSVDEKALTQERVAALVADGIPVLAYTVDDPTRAKELLSWGVSAVYTDRPREMLAAIAP